MQPTKTIILPSGKELTIDLNNITRTEWRSLLNENQSDEEEANIMGKVVGLSGEQYHGYDCVTSDGSTPPELADWILVERFGWTLEQARSISQKDYYDLLEIDAARKKAKESKFNKGS